MGDFEFIKVSWDTLTMEIVCVIENSCCIYDIYESSFQYYDNRLKLFPAVFAMEVQVQTELIMQAELEVQALFL